MWTTVAFHSGAVKEEHKYLQVYPFKDGYAVEEKGLYLDKTVCMENQRKRFEKEPTLEGVHVHGIGEKPVILKREDVIK